MREVHKYLSFTATLLVIVVCGIQLYDRVAMSLPEGLSDSRDDCWDPRNPCYYTGPDDEWEDIARAIEDIELNGVDEIEIIVPFGSKVFFGFIAIIWILYVIFVILLFIALAAPSNWRED